jgi:Flp pilus assembly pilin Flp
MHTDMLFAGLRRVTEDERGQTMIEYALIALLLSIAAVVVLGTLAGGLTSTYSDVLTAIQSIF